MYLTLLYTDSEQTLSDSDGGALAPRSVSWIAPRMTITAASACCCCAGAAGIGLIIRRYRQSRFARYEALSTADPGLDDGEEEAFPEVSEEVDGYLDAEGDAEPQDLMTADDAPSASRPSTSALSATSANWVEEMNAELAEFDALTASTLGQSPPGSGGSAAAWELDAEFQQTLAMTTPRPTQQG